MILTPMLTGTALSKLVIDGVNSQTKKHDWLINTKPAEILFAGKEPNINANRQSIQQIVKNKKINSEYIIYLLDSDVVIEDSCAFEKLEKELLTNKNIICTCANTKENVANHTVAAFCAIRYKHYEMIRFWENPGECQCLKIARLGRLKYVDDVFAYEVE